MCERDVRVYVCVCANVECESVVRERLVCDKVVCDNMCANVVGVWVCGKARRRGCEEEEEEEPKAGRRDTQQKTRTPHKDVGSTS